MITLFVFIIVKITLTLKMVWLACTKMPKIPMPKNGKIKTPTWALTSKLQVLEHHSCIWMSFLKLLLYRVFPCWISISKQYFLKADYKRVVFFSPSISYKILQIRVLYTNPYRDVIVPSYVDAHWLKKGRGQPLLDEGYSLSFNSIRVALEAIILAL